MTFKQYFIEAVKNKKVLYMARGLPGSGKTFTMSKLVPKQNIFSSDDFWGPNYEFNPEHIGHAHAWNLRKAKKAMLNGITPIGIDNVNIKWDHIKPYVKFAKENGYEVKYIESNSPWWKAISSYLKDPKFKEGNPNFEKVAEFLAKKNVHNVPIDVIKDMLNQWQPTETLPK